MTDPQSPIVVNQTVANEIRALREQQEAFYFRDKAVLDIESPRKRSSKKSLHSNEIAHLGGQNIYGIAASNVRSSDEQFFVAFAFGFVIVFAAVVALAFGISYLVSLLLG